MFKKSGALEVVRFFSEHRDGSSDPSSKGKDRYVRFFETEQQAERRIAPRFPRTEAVLWLIVCSLIFAYLTTSFWGETYDDVFLAYQYAKNIEAGRGFVFNTGEHFLGTPAPFFVALLVGVHTMLPALSLPQIGTLISSAGLSIAAYSLFALGRT
jgi:hypothetical protein